MPDFLPLHVLGPSWLEHYSQSCKGLQGVKSG